jgi:hypothetical protein
VDYLKLKEVAMSQVKIQLSMSELANLLYYWVSRCIEGPQIGTFLKDFSCDIDDAEDYYDLHQHLLVLNMWLVVTGCQSRLYGWDGLYDCMQLFHHLVYEKSIKGDEYDYVGWIRCVACRYDDYDEAMMAKGTPACFVGVAEVVGTYLWGDIKENPHSLFGIGVYVTDHYQYLTEFISKCQMH